MFGAREISLDENAHKCVLVYNSEENQKMNFIAIRDFLANPGLAVMDIQDDVRKENK